MHRLILLSLFSFLSLSAQIPSGDFETWNTFGAYMQPNGWHSTNEYSSGPFYAITRDTSHFPLGIGNYSIRLENNLSAGFPDGGGAAKTGNLFSDQEKFPITGHPTSLTGYYKFFPQSGDTMTIRLTLFYMGSEVVTAAGFTNVGEPNWVSFNLPIPSYTNADSAIILLASFKIDTVSGTAYPQGNSVLYVDNLNFDNLITGINNISSTGITIYPNPATDQLFIETGDDSEYLQLALIDQLGKTALNTVIKNEEKIDISFLPSGIYSVLLKNNQQILISKKLIVVD